MGPVRKKLGEILLEKGYITAEQLNIALTEQQRQQDQFLGAILLKKRFIGDKELAYGLSLQFTLPLVDLKTKFLDWNFLGGFSPSLILNHGIIPLEEKDLRLIVAIPNPLDMHVLKQAEDAAKIRGCKLGLSVACVSDIEFVKNRFREHFQKRL